MKFKPNTKFTNDFSKEIYEQTYKYGDEDINKTHLRVAENLASIEKDKEYWTEEFARMLENFQFTPGGRITSNAGTGLGGTSYINCFVSGFRGKHQDSMESIMDELKRQALILKSEGGYGFCANVLRPSGTFVEGIASDTPGAVRMLDMWDTQSSVITSGSGTKSKNKKAKGKIRKGAMMVTLEVIHPDIEEFIKAKQTEGRLTKFNMSVLISDKFMEAVKNNKTWDLKFPDIENYKEEYDNEWDGNFEKWEEKGYGFKIYKTYENANELWDLITNSTYNRNEPGILFVDTINKQNNLFYEEHINSTNPCVVGNSLVLTNIGWIKISNLNNFKDIKVITYDKDGVLCESELTWSGITQKDDDIIKVDFSNGEFILCNKKHKLYRSDFSEVAMGDLINNDTTESVISGNGELVDILKVTKLNYKEDVYDLTAVPNYNFFTILNREEKIIEDKIVINDNLELNFYSVIETNNGQKFAYQLEEGDEII